MVLASPLVSNTPAPSTDGQIVSLGSLTFLAREWTSIAIKYLIELVKETIENYGITFLSNNIGKGIKEQVVRDRPSETRRTWTQIRTIKEHYHKEKKNGNMSQDCNGFGST